MSAEEREQAWRERQDELLAPLVGSINGVIAPCSCSEKGAEIALRWNEGSSSLFGHKLAVVDARTGKFLSVYMQPATVARRLEFTARVIGAEVSKVEHNRIRYMVK